MMLVIYGVFITLYIIRITYDNKLNMVPADSKVIMQILMT